MGSRNIREQWGTERASDSRKNQGSKTFASEVLKLLSSSTIEIRVTLFQPKYVPPLA
jgi:hypothetical protein